LGPGGTGTCADCGKLTIRQKLKIAVGAIEGNILSSGQPSKRMQMKLRLIMLQCHW